LPEGERPVLSLKSEDIWTVLEEEIRSLFICLFIYLFIYFFNLTTYYCTYSSNKDNVIICVQIVDSRFVIDIDPVVDIMTPKKDTLK
jgi:hypothetical protein